VGRGRPLTGGASRIHPQHEEHQRMTNARLSDLLADGSIRLDVRADDREAAIRQAGEALVASGAVAPGYVDAMVERERSVSTFVGEGVAVPHGSFAAGRDLVTADAISILRLPDGVDWDGHDVRIVIGIAATGGGHIALLSRLAEILLDPVRAEQLRGATDPATVRVLLGAGTVEG
jgi:PTS system mannitol-specific IIA component